MHQDCAYNRALALYDYLGFATSIICSQDPDHWENPTAFQPERFLENTDSSSLYLCICVCVFVIVYLYLCICICVFEGSLRKPIVGPGGLSRRSALCLTDLEGGSVLESRWPKTLFVYSLPLWSSTSGVGNLFILSACNL